MPFSAIAYNQAAGAAGFRPPGRPCARKKSSQRRPRERGTPGISHETVLKLVDALSSHECDGPFSEKTRSIFEIGGDQDGKT